MQLNFEAGTILFAVLLSCVEMSATAVAVRENNHGTGTSLVIGAAHIRQKRERHIDAKQICETIFLRIPFLCYGIELSTIWIPIFGNWIGPYLFQVCNAVQGYHGLQRKKREVLAKRHAEEDSIDEYSGNHILMRHKRANAWNDLPEGWAGEKNASEGCMNNVEKIADWCHRFLGDFASRHLRDFAWLCYLTFDPTNICIHTWKNIGWICLVAVDPEGRAKEIEFQKNEQKEVERLQELPPPSPEETCQNAWTIIFTFCNYWRNILYFSPATKALLTPISVVCDGYYDGMRHILPDLLQVAKAKLSNMTVKGKIQGKVRNWALKLVTKWSGDDKKNETITADPETQASIEFNNLQQALVEDNANETHDALQTESDIDQANGETTQSIRDRMQKFGAKINSKLIQPFTNATRQMGLRTCVKFTQKLRPICQSLQQGPVDNTGHFVKYRYLCHLFAMLSGVCQTFMWSLSELCRSYGSIKCEKKLILSTPFSCENRPDGFYAEPEFPCAHYYYRCIKGHRIVRPCHEGEHFVFVESEQKCVNKLDVEGCKLTRSPCAPATVIADDPRNFPKLVTCDPTIPPTENSQNEDHKYLQTISYINFNCKNRPAGFYEDYSRCSSKFFECTRKGEARQYYCNKGWQAPQLPDTSKYFKKNWIENLVSGISNIFKKKDNVFCKNKNTVEGCSAPSCPKDHPQRRTCDPDVPAPPEGYNSKTLVFNCSGLPYGYYGDPYDKCSQHFFLCNAKTDKAKSGFAAKRLSCDLKGDDHKHSYSGSTTKYRMVFVEDYYNKCMPVNEAPGCLNIVPSCPANHKLRHEKKEAK